MENIKIVLLLQILLVILKFTGDLALPWTLILIPFEALLAVPLVTAVLYLLGVLFNVFRNAYKEAIKKIESNHLS